MNHIVCNLVNSTQNNPKIIVHEYLLTKDKNRNKKYYWYCEYRKNKNCSRRAITILENEEHILVKSTHAPEASRVDVIRTLNKMKEIAASQTHKSAQIIQDFASSFISLYAKQGSIVKINFMC